MAVDITESLLSLNRTIAGQVTHSESTMTALGEYRESPRYYLCVSYAVILASLISYLQKLTAFHCSNVYENNILLSNCILVCTYRKVNLFFNFLFNINVKMMVLLAGLCRVCHCNCGFLLQSIHRSQYLRCRMNLEIWVDTYNTLIGCWQSMDVEN